MVYLEKGAVELMSKNKRILAFDFGASSGRAIIGTYDGETIKLDEIHRFSNDPVSFNGTLYWDVLRLFHEIKQGILKAKNLGSIDSIAMDTWGVDFGLLDEDGNLLENPVHYRDARTLGMIDACNNLISKQTMYELTGLQFMELNTVFQLLYLVRNKPKLLDRAKTLLLMPDLFNYMLTGVKSTELSIASTTQLLDAKSKQWSCNILDKLSIPKRLFTKIVRSGTSVGKLSDDICKELGVEKVNVISVCSHDTQSAIAAIPAQEKDFVFISCGTWSILGTELDSPIINETSQEYNMTNESGYNNTTTFMKNIIGLWLIQESRRQWNREGKDYSFSQLEQMALEAEPFTCFIDPDSPEFGAPGNIPQRIQQYCQRTGQRVPGTVGEIVRCINESLAMKYRYTFEQLKQCTNRNYSTMHMVGGGSQSMLLCQMTANACALKVIAGPVEATVLGNIAVQLVSQGEIESLTKARQIVASSEKVIEYKPQDIAVWDKQYEVFSELLKY